jgi:hypothetical protein
MAAVLVPVVKNLVRVFTRKSIVFGLAYGMSLV